MAINVKQLLKDWDNVVMKLCDDVSPHDVISVVNDYLSLIIADCKDFEFECTKVKQAKEFLDKALVLLDPEGPDVPEEKS